MRYNTYYEITMQNKLLITSTGNYVSKTIINKCFNF